ncbi:MAG: DMT family transporter [Chlamydiota bacterium]
MSIALTVAMYAIWSSVFSFGKIALAFSPPLFLTGSRMILGAALLLGYIALYKRSNFKMAKKQWFSLFLLGFFSIYLTNILEFWGLQHLSAAKTCFIYSLSPLFTALLSYLHFKEKINGKKWLGLGIGFVGILPVLFTQTGSEGLFNSGFLSLPTLAIMGAVLASVYGWVLLRVNLKNTEVSPLMANGTSMLFGGTIALIHSFFIDSWSPLPIAQGHTSEVMGIVVIMTLLFNVLCYNLYGMMLRRYTATFLSFVGLLSPIFASLSGWLFLGEPLSWTILLSTGIVSSGLSLVYYAELKQGYIQKASKPKEEILSNT